MFWKRVHKTMLVIGYVDTAVLTVLLVILLSWCLYCRGLVEEQGRNWPVYNAEMMAFRFGQANSWKVRQKAAQLLVAADVKEVRLDLYQSKRRKDKAFLYVKADGYSAVFYLPDLEVRTIEGPAPYIPRQEMPLAMR